MEPWQQELGQALRTTEHLNQFFETEFPETNYPIMIPLKFAQKIKAQGIHSALGLQFLPNSKENNDDNGGLLDPIGDQIHHVKGQLIHRYQSRVLFLPTTRCPVICRYCFRKNELYTQDDFLRPDFDQVISYLREHSEVNEVIFSGGDPLMMSDKKIESYLYEFGQIPHIKYIRFHTRFPVIIPSRISKTFIRTLQEFQNRYIKIVMVIHVNHSDEISPEFIANIRSLTAIKNVEILSQSVLLRGVNDNVQTLKDLFEMLSCNHVKPYYLHHPDPAKGAMHFTLPLVEGQELYLKLRNQLPGWQIPHYMLEQESGKGKIWALNKIKGMAN